MFLTYEYKVLLYLSPSLSFSNTHPISIPLSFIISLSLSPLLKIGIYCFPHVYLQARTRPRKPYDNAYTVWTDHTQAYTQAHVVHTHIKTHTHLSHT